MSADFAAIAAHPLAHREGLALMLIHFVVEGTMCGKCGTPTSRVNKTTRRCSACKTRVEWVRDDAELSRRFAAKVEELSRPTPARDSERDEKGGGRA